MSVDVSLRNSHNFRNLQSPFMHRIKTTRDIQFDSLSDFTKTEMSRKESIPSDSTNSLITMKIEEHYFGTRKTKTMILLATSIMQPQKMNTMKASPISNVLWRRLKNS
ncbi:hypothetical protein L1987_36196 [Smallanthus sonchifolius]|uniref:Uncharacterized protein n=1 Tax=Smallanthus sonchifolius TaxID=185202 RepID=A0ACB9HE18_9ASTR|nr:hypothetical protein L1987_36196 [Smallanthus sonchifolius]